MAAFSCGKFNKTLQSMARNACSRLQSMLGHMCSFVSASSSAVVLSNGMEDCTDASDLFFYVHFQYLCMHCTYVCLALSDSKNLPLCVPSSASVCALFCLCVCPLLPLCVPSAASVCVLACLCVCPHLPLRVPSSASVCVLAYLCVCPHLPLCVS